MQHWPSFKATADYFSSLTVKRLICTLNLLTAKTPKYFSRLLPPPMQVDFLALRAALPQKCVRDCSMAQPVCDYQDNPL